MLLKTKLFIPTTQEPVVARPHLLERLNTSLDGKLTLIAAPAGFGKTTLVSSWIQSPQFQHHVAWVALDAEDSDPVRFFRYIAAAVQTLTDNALVLAQLVKAEQLTPPRTFVTALINDLLGIELPTVLVLDDYHTLQSLPINEAIAYLLDYMPPQMHLVILSRSDPMLPVSRLRARRQMVEIRAVDLRLAAGEVFQLLEQIGIQISQTEAEMLADRTEGWVTGVQLAALAMGTSAVARDTEQFIRTLSGSNRYIMDYLTDEVLRRRSLAIEAFLLQTAILKRFNTDLCAAVLLDQGAGHLLSKIDQANLFLIPLDEERDWYRYHHLFADLLRQRLTERFDADHITDLHRRAIRWLCDHALIEEAIDHAAIIDEWPVISDTVAQLGTLQIYQGDTNRVRGWFKRIPTPVILANPRVAADMAWLCYVTFDIVGLLPFLEAAEAEVDDLAHVGETAVIRALYLMATGETLAAVTYAESIEAKLDWAKYPAEKGSLLFMLGNGYDLLDRPQARLKAFQQAVVLLEHGGNLAGYSAAVGMLIRYYQTAGDLQLAVDLGEAFLTRFQADERLQNGGGVQALVLYTGTIFEQYDDAKLPLADYLLSNALALTQITMSGTVIDYWQYGTAARVKLALGEIEMARAYAAQAADTLRNLPPAQVTAVYVMPLVQLYLFLNDLQQALLWLDQLDESTLIHHIYHATAKMVLTPNDRAALRRARDQIQAGLAVRSFDIVYQYGSVVIGVLEDQLGDREAALTSLVQAIETAAPQGWIAPFTLPLKRLADLMGLVRTRSGHQSFITRVLAVIGRDAAQPSSRQTFIASADGYIIEPLSNRERELLRLVADGRSNRDIAQKLHLAVGTVKRHLSNINSKLHATNRTEAVSRARALNLL